MKKQKEQYDYPFATIARYGPDDKVTTKIVVGIFKNDTDDPMLRQWVGVGIFYDREAQSQIHAFLKEQGVRKVVATEGNMGCPHEEELDFPRGGDCPFCPFWKGKQGSGAKNQ